MRDNESSTAAEGWAARLSQLRMAIEMTRREAQRTQAEVAVTMAILESLKRRDAQS